MIKKCLVCGFSYYEGTLEVCSNCGNVFDEDLEKDLEGYNLYSQM